MERKDYIDHVDILTKKVREIRAYNTRVLRVEGAPCIDPIEQDKYDKAMKKLDDLADFLYETSALSMKVLDDHRINRTPEQGELKLAKK